MTDYAELIKESVPMDAILRKYGLLSYNITRRIPCPLHHGEKNNFTFRGHMFKCFVCGASGSTIDFVMQYKGLSFLDAMRDINEEFGLGYAIGERDGDERNREAVILAERLRAERIRRQNRLKQLLTIYDAAMDWYAVLDVIAQEGAPEGPYDPVTPQYGYAVKHIDAAWEDVQNAAEAIRRFEKEGDANARVDGPAVHGGGVHAIDRAV